jgi:glycosyltransferase involved in cell wall biosynthesis
LGSELERYPFCSQSINSELEFQLNENEIFKLIEESRMADFVFVASSFTKKTLVENSVDPKKVFVVPYGVDSLKFSYIKKDKKSRTFNILFLGQMVQRKGLADLLCAVEMLSSKNIKVFICGRGYVDKGILNYFSHLNLDIRYNISHLELVHLVKEIDLFVLPSLVEGFGHVVLETMSMGLVPITSSHTCGPDIIQNGVDGFVINPKDPHSLAQIIEENIERNSDLEELGYLASKKASEFTWEKFKKSIIAYYISLYEN